MRKKKKTKAVKKAIQNKQKPDALLKKLEKELGLLVSNIRKPKDGDAIIKFFRNADGVIQCFVFYGLSKIYFWGEIRGQYFLFDRSVPVKFLPEGKEKLKIDFL